jgi:glycosyltransferase involved in cell wall biosynthesis
VSAERSGQNENHNVELWIKLTRDNDFPFQNKTLPAGVRVLVQRMETSELVELMHQSTCFVFPSHGEVRALVARRGMIPCLSFAVRNYLLHSSGLSPLQGFGLPPREAMSTGLPVILAGFLGLKAIANNSMNFPVPFALTSASGYEVWRPNNFNSNDFGQWAFVSVDDLAAVMKRAHQDIAEVLQR